ncbi:MAG TPA: hypothetical protein VKH81_07445 [Candidatus Angelobacter sp.]|nr:hypothetical protein [Candidatus Angelobacter sp.]
MKELFSAFSTAVFYPLVGLCMPGLSGISGWYILLMTQPPFRSLVSRNHTETAFVLMLLSIFVGTIVDDLGTRLESQWLDRARNRRTHGAHRQEWWAYLRKPFEVEPSGRRHLRKLVARLKFELGVAIGVVLTIPAVWLNSAIGSSLAIMATVIGAALVAYLLLEAKATHNTLGDLRHELLKEGGIISLPTRKIVQSIQG